MQWREYIVTVDKYKVTPLVWTEGDPHLLFDEAMGEGGR